MATEKQIEANRANAQKSTGPRTLAGKAISCMNNFSWGFCSSGILMPGENPAEFRSLLDDLLDQHQPANVTEQILVEKMAQNKWLSDRAFRLQSESFIANMMASEKFAIPKELGLLIRYQTSAQNAFHKAHNELVKAQKERKKSEIGFESQSPSGQPKTGPQLVTVTWVDNDSSPKPAAPAEEFVFSGPELVKTAV